jgi:16S rRNA G1207 methylase RsmC
MTLFADKGTAWKRIEHRHIKPLARHLKPWRTTSYAGIRVHYKKHLDGGGTSFGQNFIPFLHQRGMPKQQRVFEWCAGPAFIGFSMLAYGLCETLCLADINKLAVRACEKTIRDNGLSTRVSVYHSNNLLNIASSERWDLVVSNPPHFLDAAEGDIRSLDVDWHIHRGFFATVNRFLKPNGVIVLQENNRGSTPQTFDRMLAAEGFSIVFAHGAVDQLTPYDSLYFIGIMRRGDERPGWAA